MAIIFQDDFTGATIDTNKWTETDPNSRISQNGNISISNPHSSNISEFADKLQSVSSLSSGVIVVQGKIDWTTDSSGESVGGIYLFKDSNNFAYIGSRAAGGNFRLRIYQGGVSQYSLDSSVGKNKDVKIVYNVSTNVIKFYYWDTGSSAWVQIGTDQTFNLGTPLYYLISHIDNTTFNGANPVTIDDAYLSDADYSTQYPSASSFEYTGDLSAILSATSDYITGYVYSGDVSAILSASAEYSGPVEYTGNLSIINTSNASYIGYFIYTGNLGIVLALNAVKTYEFIYTGKTTLELSPASSVSVENYKPYSLRAIIKIDGVDYSPDVYGTVTVSKDEDSAATFQFSLNSASAPSSFLDKEVKISFQSANASGTVIDIIDLVIGKIRDCPFDVDSGALDLAGYDYGGIQNNPGEFYSGEVTTVLTGDIYISASGTYDIGKKPIWDVVCPNNPDIVDGTDYYADTLNGIIYIPFSSKLVTSHNTLQYKYGEYFHTYQELIETLAALKGWTVSMENVSIPEYSDEKYQPLVVLSNESVIDAVRKCLEVGGCKLDSSLYPTMRVYSEVINCTKGDYLTFDESSIYEDTLSIKSTLENLINKQTVRGVSVVNTNVILGDWQQASSQSGTVSHKNYWWFAYGVPYGVTELEAYGAAVDKMNSTPDEEVASFEVSLDALFDYNYVHTGGGSEYTFDLCSYLSVTTTSIKGDPQVVVDDDTKKLKVKVTRPLKIMKIDVQIFTLAWRGFLLYYPQVDYNLVVNTKELEYGDGVATPLVEVTGRRAIEGITEELVGDVYEHVYLETEDQAQALCKAILYSRGLKTEASFSVPLHKASDLKIGKRAIVSSKGCTVDGIIKSLNYVLDIDNGSGVVDIVMKGTGTNI